jgi:hypothetical protein
MSRLASSRRMGGISVTSRRASMVLPAYSIWDVARLQRQRSSRGHKEPLDIDFAQIFGKGIPCLSAHLGSRTYRSYPVVMPREVLAPPSTTEAPSTTPVKCSGRGVVLSPAQKPATAGEGHVPLLYPYYAARDSGASTTFQGAG